MRSSSKTPTALAKKEIQRLVREIVMIRDEGCFLKGFRFQCNEVLQADHLISRGKNIGFADTRLINCLCSAHHTAKTFDKSGDYEEELAARMDKERTILWQRTKKDRKPYPMSAWEWSKEIIALTKELESYT